MDDKICQNAAAVEDTRRGGHCCFDVVKVGFESKVTVFQVKSISGYYRSKLKYNRRTVGILIRVLA
jgi:hypothetical protein